MDFDGTDYYTVYQYNDSFVGFKEGHNMLDCWELLSYEAIVENDDLIPDDLVFDSKFNEYTYQEDNLFIILRVDENGIISDYSLSNEDGIVIELTDFNSVTFDMPDYEVYTPIDFTLSLYPNVDYQLTDQILRIDSDDWIMVYDMDEDEMTLSHTSNGHIYTHDYRDDEFKNTNTETVNTILDLVEADNSVDEEFFSTCARIHIGVENVSSLFDIPEIEPSIVFPGSGE
jgi:hypothetical protein